MKNENIYSALLILNNSANAGYFYKKAFGATETYQMESPNGGLVLLLPFFFNQQPFTGDIAQSFHSLFPITYHERFIK